MRRLLLIFLCGSLALPAGAISAEQGLVADYDFSPTNGPLLLDRSGHSNHGQIHGAAFAPSGNRFALRLDGANDRVDCGAPTSLNLTRAITVETWVYPNGVPGAGEPGVVGKSHGSYLLTYYTNGAFWWYISGGGNRCQAAAAASTWHHVVGTFDGTFIKLYIDGTLADTCRSTVAAIPSGGPLFLGVNASNREPARWSYFKGMLAEVKIFDRALTGDEVKAHFRSTHPTQQLVVKAEASVFRSQVLVSLDLRGLGELPTGTKALVELSTTNPPNPLAHQRTGELPAWGQAETAIRVADLPAGKYALRTTVLAANGQPIGRPVTIELLWPGRPEWPEAPHARILNNLVTELLSARPVTTPGDGKYRFENPRDGWVFIAATPAAAAPGPVRIRVDGGALGTLRFRGSDEAMCFLAKGPHVLEVSSARPPDRLVVRAVPELVFASYGAHPHVPQFGRYDWEFLGRHVLPNLNVLVGEGYENEEQRRLQPELRHPDVAGATAEPGTRFRPIERWKQLGRRWLVECGVPGSREKSTTPEEAFRYWAGHKGLTDPLLDGLIVDEFGGGDDDRYTAWTAAIQRIRADQRFRGHQFYPYCSPMYGAKASRQFLQVALDTGWRFAFERYLPEQPTLAQARTSLRSSLSEPIAAWRREMPGAERHMIVCMGTFSQPPESLDIDPAVNHKTFLDLQLNLLANDPACFNLYGVMTYLSSYTDEETVRWMGKLFRHYCIEGNVEPLARDPYRLPHLENPDFEDGLAGWTVEPASPGSIAARSISGFSWLQGRYPQTRKGDTVLWMKHSGNRSNTLSQRVKRLEPGRLYTLRMYSADGRNLSVKPQGRIAIRLDGVDLLPEKSFEHLFPNCYSHHQGPFNEEHRAWMSFHWVVFRARGPEAVLRISDHAGADPAQEVVLNFVQIQPYDE